MHCPRLNFALGDTINMLRELGELGVLSAGNSDSQIRRMLTGRELFNETR